jgi:hypothetical protein
MSSAGVLHIDPGEISRVILDQERLFQPPCPGAKHIVPVANVAKVNAIFPDLSWDGGKETEKELGFV